MTKKELEKLIRHEKSNYSDVIKDYVQEYYVGPKKDVNSTDKAINELENWEMTTEDGCYAFYALGRITALEDLAYKLKLL